MNLKWSCWGCDIGGDTEESMIAHDRKVHPERLDAEGKFKYPEGWKR